MQDFPVEGGPPKVWGSDFSRVERNFTIAKALKFGGIFQKYALNLIKFENLLRKFEKNAKFRKIFEFSGGP